MHAANVIRAETDGSAQSLCSLGQSLFNLLKFFTALHLCRAVLAMSEMSVRLSVKRVICDKTKKNFCRNSYTVYKARSSSFLKVKWLVGTTPCT